jgi:hypothetical protein
MGMIAIPLPLLLLSPSSSAQAVHQDGKSPALKAQIQHDNERRQNSDMNLSGMMQEPDHLLSMAYAQSIGRFTKALKGYSAHATSFDTHFARPATEEINRSFDEMEKHHREHMRAMSGSMDSDVSTMVEKWETHRLKLKDAIGVLEKDVEVDSPDTGRIVADCEEILKHLDEMSAMHGAPSHSIN